MGDFVVLDKYTAQRIQLHIFILSVLQDISAVFH